MVGTHPLKNFRSERGLTQEALAALLEVDPITVSRWETGARRIDGKLLQAVAEKTGIPKRELRPDLAEVMREAAE